MGKTVDFFSSKWSSKLNTSPERRKRNFVHSKSAITKIQAILIIVIVVAAAAAGTYYYMMITTPKEITLTVMVHWGDPVHQELYWEPIKELYEKENPHIKIEYIYVESGEQHTKIATMHAAGNLPDIHQISSGWLPDDVEHSLWDEPPKEIQDFVREEFWPAAVELSSYKGVIWGVPAEMTIQALQYNKDILAEAGYTEPPKTWSEMIKVAKAVTKYDAEGKIVRAGWQFYFPTPAYLWHYFRVFLLSNGGKMIERDSEGNPVRAVFNSTEGVEVLTEFVKCIYDYKITSTELTPSEDYPMERIAMFLQGNWMMMVIKTRASEEAMARYPWRASMPPYFKKPATCVHGYTWVVADQCKHKEEAWKFVKWLFTEHPNDPWKGTPMGDFLAWWGLFPSKKSDWEVYDEIKNDPYMSTFVDLIPYAQPLSLYLPYGSAEFYTSLVSELENAIYQKKTPKQALDDAAAKWNEIIREYYG